MPIELSKNYKRLGELITAVEEVSEQWEREKQKTPISEEEVEIQTISHEMQTKNYWYRLQMIAETNAKATNQPHATRQTATFVTFDTGTAEVPYRRSGRPSFSFSFCKR